MPLRNFMASCRDRLARSRFFTVSLTFHLLLIVFIGQQIITRYEPPEVVPNGEIRRADVPEQAPKPSIPAPPNYDPAKDVTQQLQEISKFPSSVLPPALPTPIIVDGSGPFSPATPGVPNSPLLPSGPTNPAPNLGSLTPAERKDIQQTLEIWRPKGSGPNEFSFTAYIGKYQGGNWASTVRLTNGEITAGSLPNLLYAMSKWSKNRIKTNERQVKAIALDSDELLTVRPPFVFLTGTRDFKLTEKEIENLRNYIRIGGAIWGDSSVPGRRSAFDHAFKREMQIVLKGNAEKFEKLPASHPVFTDGYFAKVKQLPAGINNYQEPVEVLRWGGEIAVIHTTNDYGDMWQVGLDKEGQIDLSRDAGGQYVAMNPTLWENRGTYVRNIDQPAVEQAYRFGINMVVHLLTRWENKVGGAATL